MHKLRMSLRVVFEVWGNCIEKHRDLKGSRYKIFRASIFRTDRLTKKHYQERNVASSGF